MGYRGPYKEPGELSEAVRNAMAQRPDGPYMWRKCKTVLKVESRCNEDVWNAAREEAEQSPRRREARIYLAELCRAHIPVINRLVQSYRLATYDYFAYSRIQDSFSKALSMFGKGPSINVPHWRSIWFFMLSS